LPVIASLHPIQQTNTVVRSVWRFRYIQSILTVKLPEIGDTPQRQERAKLGHQLDPQLGRTEVGFVAFGGLSRQNWVARHANIAPEITGLMRTLAQSKIELRQCAGIFEGIRATSSIICHSVTRDWLEIAVPARLQPH
jgi:hypothetical protein